ncbi:hypothetical protein [Spirulina subsalsa]|uniref:hypothetical protein n=1 Tax=Spirulina subsalsa TaxID=54311 RepID=UPI00192AB6AB|nr:hypothetical protein [Spirulina subsalsa]
MADPSSSSPISLNVLLHEIEATPQTYWRNLLGILRQFRQNVASTPPTPNPEQAQQNQAAVDLLDSWLGDDEDEAEHQQAWDFLETALDEDRLSDRPLFP